MRAVMLMFDSLNRHMLEPYGCDWTFTPNFKRLAEKTVTFDNCYAGSLPCMPARRELHTGRYNFLHRGWGPIEPYDDSMPEILKNRGIYTHMISDHQHYWEDGGCTYHHRYNSWEIVRGQEGDRWKGVVKDPEIPSHQGLLWRQDVINRKYLDTESKQPQTTVINLGLEFMECNKDADNWFLHIETFDPHEPFYSMEEYKKLYPHRYDGPHFDWPEYKPVTEDEESVNHCRYQYAALLSMCDMSLGRVLDFFDEHDMWKDTLLIVNTDHGFLLGEHDWWAKCVQPFYNEVAHTPLFIWDPRLKICGQRRESLVQTIDIPATLFEFFKMDIPADMQGKPLKGVIETDSDVREAALFGMHGGQLNITDGRYVYMRNRNTQNRPLYDYTHMPTHMRSLFSVEEMRTVQLAPPFSFTKGCPVMKIESTGFTPRIKGLHDKTYQEDDEIFATRLYDLESDPQQTNPIEDKEIEDRMIRHMVRLMQENDAPLEQFERLELELKK